MDAAERRSLAKSLKKGRYKWSMRLPAEAGMFYEKRVGFEISPLLWGKKGEPPLTAQETKLIDQILQHLPKLIRKAEKEWWAYHGDPDYAEHVSNPHVWISREDQSNEKRGKWSFVVELRDDPEFGGYGGYAWHLEFKGTRFVEIWAGS
jgi:hypothetical protein